MYSSTELVEEPVQRTINGGRYVRARREANAMRRRQYERNLHSGMRSRDMLSWSQRFAPGSGGHHND